MSTTARFYLGLSLSVLLVTSVSPARAQSPVGAFYAQREAILQEQAKQQAASGGDQKADAGSASSSPTGSASGSSSTETKADDNKGSDTKAGDTKKEDTSAGDSDKKADSDKDDDKKKSDSDEDSDKKKSDDDDKKSDDDDKKTDDKKTAKSGKSDKSDKKAAADAYSPVKAAIFEMNSGNAKGAISTLKGVLDKNPKDVQAHYVLGAAYVMARQYQDAIDQYNTVLKLVPPTSKLGQLASQGLKNISK